MSNYDWSVDFKNEKKNLLYVYREYVAQFGTVVYNIWMVATHLVL